MVRHKKRYFVVSVELQKKRDGYISSDSLKSSIINAVVSLYGEFGVAVTLNGLQVKYSNLETGIFYIKINREVHAIVAAAISVINSVGSEEAIVSLLYTAATLRHANIFLKDYHMKCLRRANNSQETTVNQNVIASKNSETSLANISKGSKRKSETTQTYKERVIERRKKRV